MFLEDKASGEIGTRIKHPLQAKFEQSLYRVLGNQDKWRVGDKIQMIEFNNIKNKGYVRNSLAKLNFVLGKDVNTFVYAGEHGEYKPQEPLDDASLEATAKQLNPKGYYGKVEIKELLDRYESFTTEGLPTASKRRIAMTVSVLRSKDGLKIKAKVIKDGMACKAVIYSLVKPKKYISPDEKPYQDCLKESVLDQLKSKGVVTNEGLSLTKREKLSQTIKYLKQRGYEIEITRKWSEKTGKEISVYKLKNL